MNIILAPFTGNMPDKSLDYRQSFNGIIKQYSLLKANEEGRNDVFEVTEADSIEALGEYVKNHSVLLGTGDYFTLKAFRHFLAKNPGAGLLSLDSGCSCLELVKTGALSHDKLIFAATMSCGREDVDYITAVLDRNGLIVKDAIRSIQKSRDIDTWRVVRDETREGPRW